MTACRSLLAGFLAAALGLASAAEAATGDADLPARVGRLAQIAGTVSFHTADEQQWEAATLNYPITGGNSLWTEPQSHAAIDIGGGRIYLDGSTELDIGRLDDQSFVASLPQGAVFLRVASLASDGGFEIDTPRGAITIGEAGQYEIAAGDASHPTTVVALSGSARIAGPGITMNVVAGQTAFLTGQDPVVASSGPAQQDDFIRYAYGAEQPYQAAPAAQYVSPATTGYQDLAQYGQWQQSPDYGAVWAPRVAVGWAPYRYGHWAFVAPWGWTWIDDAPWGFAPFHYGRWVQINSAWCWAPGIVVARPVYAPALVTFFGDVGGVGVSFGFGPAVSWVPLGPGEIWVPPYHHSPSYIREVNITNVSITNIVQVTNNVSIVNRMGIDRYVNRRGATLIPASAMIASRPVGPAFRALPAKDREGRLSQMTPRGGDWPVKPNLHTAGITPSLARQWGETLPAGGSLPGRQSTPGPKILADGGGRGGAASDNAGHLPSFLGAPTSSVAQRGGAPGPTLPPFTTAGQPGKPQATASADARGQGNRGAETRASGLGQSWSFLPPLQGPGSGSRDRQRGLQTLGLETGAGPMQPPQVLRNRGGTSQAGAGANSDRRWASLPPLQQQPQAVHGGQTGYQGGGNGGNWQQPRNHRQDNGQGGSQPPAQATGKPNAFHLPQPESEEIRQQGQGRGFTFLQKPPQKAPGKQPDSSRNGAAGGTYLKQQGGG
jgi:hypothetical protein